MGERGEKEREREGKEKREGSRSRSRSKRMTRRGICQQHMMQWQRRRQVSSSIQPQCTLYLWGVESPVASFGTVRHVCVTMLIVTDIPPAQIIAHEQDHVRRRCCTDAAISKQQHHESSIEAKHASCKHPSAGTTGGTKTNVLIFFVTVLTFNVIKLQHNCIETSPRARDLPPPLGATELAAALPSGRCTCSKQSAPKNRQRLTLFRFAKSLSRLQS